jgi:hypothetical protein
MESAGCFFPRPMNDNALAWHPSAGEDLNGKEKTEVRISECFALWL